MGVDLEQAELRVAALISGEESLLLAFTAGLDLHQDRAAWVFRTRPEDVTHEQRQVGKTVNFADLYLAGARKLQETITEMSGVDPGLDFCRQIVQSRHRQRPDLTRWQHALLAEATERGRIELPITGQSRSEPQLRRLRPRHLRLAA
jgi:DNA polymerase-1